MSLHERWLLPERPGMRQFLIALAALLLPIASLLHSEGTHVASLVASITIGCGLGIAWMALTGWQWLKLAPVNSVCVFLTCFGSLGNLELMPRWDVALRAREALSDLQFYARERGQGRTAELRDYDTGPAKARFREITRPADGRLITAFTGDPIQRWSPFGFKPSCYVMIRADGTWSVVKNRDELNGLIEIEREKAK
ncbi:MAG: hypothetical protein H0V44_19205 [Planctomycetes bacterium]|nr:hypothetical protein [Planctomycetota bacterium]